MRNVDMTARSTFAGGPYPTCRSPAGCLYLHKSHGPHGMAYEGISICVRGRPNRDDVSAHHFNVCFGDSKIDIRVSRRVKSDSQVNGVCSYPRIDLRREAARRNRRKSGRPKGICIRPLVWMVRFGRRRTYITEPGCQ